MSKLFVTVFIVAFVAFCGGILANGKLGRYRTLRAGQPLPPLLASTVGHHSFLIPKSGAPRLDDHPLEGRFFLYFVDADQKSFCVDQECGDSLFTKVRERGGHYIAFSDGKGAQLFGVELESGPKYSFDRPLAVITDGKSEIRALYPGATHDDLEKIVETY